MKRFIAVTLTGLLLACTAVAQDPAPPTEEKKKTVRRQRMENQQKRINEGVKEGSLTKKEAVKLEMKQGALAKEVREEKKDGGGLTAKEKIKIDNKQDKLSREIYREKHDAQTKKK
ncbi:MAG: hypothetical protein JNL98_01620 [Bryobacterales bacterium]|nr:hypothetical protein [Bryobacterales bacterium]